MMNETLIAVWGAVVVALLYHIGKTLDRLWVLLHDRLPKEERASRHE